MESEEFDPKLKTLEQIAELGEVSISELLGEKSTRSSNPTFSGEFSGEKQQCHAHSHGVHVHINNDEQYLRELLESKDQLLKEKERVLQELEKRLLSQENLIQVLQGKEKS